MYKLQFCTFIVIMVTSLTFFACFIVIVAAIVYISVFFYVFYSCLVSICHSVIKGYLLILLETFHCTMFKSSVKCSLPPKKTALYVNLDTLHAEGSGYSAGCKFLDHQIFAVQ